MKKGSSKSSSGRTKNSAEAALKIRHPAGLHARPAAVLVSLAKKFPAEIVFRKGAIKVNGKSMLGVLMLGAREGETVHVEASGLKADEALSAIREFFEAGFNE